MIYRKRDDERRCCAMLSVAFAAVIMLAMVAAGCGGGGSKSVVPTAGVWVANSGVARVLHFPGVNFAFNGTVAAVPLPVVTTPFTSPQDTLFDNANNMWLVDGGNAGVGAAVFKFSFSQLANLNVTPNPVPVFTISNLGGPVKFVFPQFAAFDGNGNLFVSDSVANVIFKFSAGQLLLPNGVGLTPSVFTSAGFFNGPLGIAFDSTGNLWILNNGGTTIVELTAGQVAAPGGAVVPNTVLNSVVVPGGLPTINNPWGILFDPAGNMWFTNEQNVPPPMGCAGSVVEFAAGSFSGPGPVSPAAHVVLTKAAMGATSSLCDPNGITMNKNGDIVVANAVGESLSHYTAAQITSSGAVVPSTFIIGGATLLNAPTGLTFGPAALK